jgi:hypothetical protein
LSHFPTRLVCENMRYRGLNRANCLR